MSNPYISKQADTERSMLKRKGYSEGASSQIQMAKKQNTFARVFGKPVKPI